MLLFEQELLNEMRKGEPMLRVIADLEERASPIVVGLMEEYKDKYMAGETPPHTGEFMGGLTLYAVALLEALHFGLKKRRPGADEQFKSFMHDLIDDGALNTTARMMKQQPNVLAIIMAIGGVIKDNPSMKPDKIQEQINKILAAANTAEGRE